MRQIQSLLYSWLLATNIQLMAAATFTKPHAYSPLGRDLNDKYDAAYFIGQSQWACSPVALSALKPAIGDAQRLAQAAINVLQVSGSETSEAFENWFGDSNANPQTVTELLNEHFKPAMTHFIFPSHLAGIASENGQLSYKVLPKDPPPSGNSLVYACPPSTPNQADICGSGTVAAIAELTDRPEAPTILALCPEFFQLTTTVDQMVQAWKARLTIEPLSQGFTLLHELQHMRKATSPSIPAVDLEDPNDNAMGCYSPGCCAALPAANKIRNAQNYALFALDVLAFPERAKPQVKACGRPVVRRQAEPSLCGSKAPANSTASRRSNTQKPSSTTGSFRPIERTSSLGSSLIVERTSSSPLPPPPAPTSTRLPSYTLTTIVQPTTSAHARVTVSNGDTFPVVVGMIVTGGAGGGFIRLNEKTIPIAAGQTITVTDSTFADDGDSNNEPSVKPTSKETPSSTSSTQSTSSDAPTCSSQPRGFSGTTDFSDKSINLNNPASRPLFAGLTFGTGPLDNDTSSVPPQPTSTVTTSSTAPPPPRPAPTAAPITVMSLDESNIPGGQGSCFPASIDVNLIAGGHTSFQYQFTLDSPVSKFTVGPYTSGGPFLFQADGSKGSGSGSFTIGTGDTSFYVCVTNNGDNPAHLVLSIFY